MIELERLYGLLSSFLGESKQGGYIDGVTQYQFNCPYCADEKGHIDGKYNAEFSFSNSGFVFHCWSCNHSGSFSKIIKRWGGVETLKEYYTIVNDLKENHLYEFEETIKREIEAPQIKLPASFKKINLKTCRNNTLKQYLKQRCIDQWTINKFNIGYTEKDDSGFSYRIIVPSYNDLGQLNYFVGRDYLPADTEKDFKRIKYKNCDVDKKTIVFQESLIDFDSDVVLVEGALDCIYGPNTISMLGKYLTPDSALFSALVERAKAKVIICLDNDTKVSETLKICRLLEDTKLSGRVYYIQMNEYKDFGEAFEKDGVDGIIKCIRSAVKYDKDKDF